MIADVVRRYLEQHAIPYRVVPHPAAIDAQRTAAAAHVSGWTMLKCVVVRSGAQHALCAVPAPELVDLDAASKALGGGPTSLVDEAELTRLCPGCELGAAPPLGGLFGLPVLCDRSIASRRAVAMNGGTHRELVVLATFDYLVHERPRLLALGRLPGAPWPHAEPAALPPVDVGPTS